MVKNYIKLVTFGEKPEFIVCLICLLLQEVGGGIEEEEVN